MIPMRMMTPTRDSTILTNIIITNILDKIKLLLRLVELTLWFPEGLLIFIKKYVIIYM